MSQVGQSASEEIFVYGMKTRELTLIHNVARNIIFASLIHMGK